MKYAIDLTDLLNNDPQAYTYFYALPAQMQTDLRRRDIRSMEELKAAADEGRFEELLMPVDAAFRQYKSIFLSPKQTKMFLDGIRLDTNRIKIPAEGDTVRVYGESRFLALAHIERSIAELQIIKLFYTKENPNC